MSFLLNSPIFEFFWVSQFYTFTDIRLLKSFPYSLKIFCILSILLPTLRLIFRLLPERVEVTQSRRWRGHQGTTLPFVGPET